MAELDGKRIYSLTDEQSSYSPDIYLAVDDSSFTSGTKKVKMGAIYPLIDTLDEATDINPATSELRISVSAGDEQRMTIENMLEDSDVQEVIKDGLGIGIKLRLSATVSAIGISSKINGDLSVSATKPSTGRYVITHNLGKSSANYMVIANTVTDVSTESQIKIASIYQGSTDMVIHTANDSTADDSDFRFSLFEFTL